LTESSSLYDKDNPFTGYHNPFTVAIIIFRIILREIKLDNLAFYKGQEFEEERNRENRKKELTIDGSACLMSSAE
jgi:hypothetical protein